MTTICTVQNVVISNDTSYSMVYSNNYHDIFQFSYVYDITPSVILPYCTNISNGHQVSVVNTDYLSISATIFTLPPHMSVTFLMLDNT